MVSGATRGEPGGINPARSNSFVRGSLVTGLRGHERKAKEIPAPV
jgi:hypothetical protein